MTRINVVPVSELCDQHLIAEFRELTRIPNAVARGRFDMYGQPLKYTLGPGHVRFFYNKLGWLRDRYADLLREGMKRGFKFNPIWPDDAFTTHPEMFNDYEPTTEAVQINRERIRDRYPARARWTKSTPPAWLQF